jgi:hypothetical protein
MSSKRKSQLPQPASDDLPACFDSPDQLWGRRFGRPLLDAGLPFEERVALAWEHIKSTRFVPDEHKRLREVLVKLVEGEVVTARPSLSTPSGD